MSTTNSNISDRLATFNSHLKAAILRLYAVIYIKGMMHSILWSGWRQIEVYVRTFLRIEVYVRAFRSPWHKESEYPDKISWKFHPRILCSVLRATLSSKVSTVLIIWCSNMWWRIAQKVFNYVIVNHFWMKCMCRSDECCSVFLS